MADPQALGTPEAHAHRVSLAVLAAKPKTFTSAERARLEAMSDEAIDAAIAADTVNPTWSDDDLARAAFARTVRLAREKTSLSQALFADRFHITLPRLREWKRARLMPVSVAAAYVKTILASLREAVERTLAGTQYT